MNTTFFKLLLINVILLAFVTDNFGQGFGLGTNAPTEVLHIYKNGGDAAIRFQTQTAGTGAITLGPNSGTSSSLAGIGSIVWSNPTFADATDNTYATSTVGTSQYLYSSTFGFAAIPPTATINSITVEVEKSFVNNPVTILDAWTTRNTNSFLYDPSADANSSRILIVSACQTNRNGTTETLTGVTFGGQPLTKVNNTTQTNSDDSSLEVWYLNDAGIVTGGGDIGPQTLTFTWSTPADIEDQIYAVATYRYVDQATPISANDANATAGKVLSLQLQATVNVNIGDVMLAIGSQADNKSFDVVPTGYTELFDVTHANNRGATMTVNEKPITTAGTEQPTVTGQAANTEEMHISGIVINNGYNGTTVDNSVSLYSGGTTVGVDKASGVDWGTTDAYETYGGVDDWGGVSVAQINAGDFGVVLSVTVGGTYSIAKVDYVRVTITYTDVPAAYTNWVSGIDYSDGGKYKLSYNSSLGTNDFLTIDATGNSVFTGTVTASCGVLSCSDIRYKKNIVPIKGALNKIKLLEGVNYYWKKDDFPEKHFTDEKQIGLIAQELEKIYPELVQTDANGYKTVDYSHITPILIEAIKEQQAIIEELKNNVDVLSSKIENTESLEKRINSLESSIKSLTELLNLTSSSKK